MRKIIMSIFLLFSITAFSQVINHNETIRIDPANSKGGGVAQFFDTVKYIPLETTAESLFGSIYQLEVTPKYYIILDRNTNSILLFNKNGQFHSKIKGGDQSLLENVIHFFNVDNEKKRIMFRHRRSMHYYNFNGKELSSSSNSALPNSMNRFWFNDSTNVDFDQYFYEKLPDATAFELTFYLNTMVR